MIELRGEINEWDKENESAHIETAEGTIPVKFNGGIDYDVIRYSFDTYDKSKPIFRPHHIILLTCYEKDGEYRVTNAEKLSELDPIHRLEVLGRAGDNWDGEGTKAPTKKQLEWFVDFFKTMYPENTRFPYIALGEGCWFLEWEELADDKQHYIRYCGCDIDFDTHKAEGYIDFKIDEIFEEFEYDLNTENGREELFKKLAALGPEQDDD